MYTRRFRAVCHLAGAALLAIVATAAYGQATTPTNLSVDFTTGKASWTITGCGDVTQRDYRTSTTGSWTTSYGYGTTTTISALANPDYGEFRIRRSGDTPCNSFSPWVGVSYAATTLSLSSGANPANLQGATLTLTLGDDETTRANASSPETFLSSAAAAHFTLAATGITGLTISGVSVSSGGRTATLTLAHSGTGAEGDEIAITVVAAAHTGSNTLTGKVVLPFDYDDNDNGLIDIRTLAQLDAMRWDLDGDGAPTSANAASYRTAFPSPAAGMGCPTNADDADDNDCTGYELRADLDFDTDGDGATHIGGASDSGDAYHNGGSGWAPIGAASRGVNTAGFNTSFNGNGRLISNLFINRSSNYAGLFSATGPSARISALGLADARIQGARTGAGALAGQNQGRIAASWSSGSVQGFSLAGGLVGHMETASATVVACYSTASVNLTGSRGQGAGLVGFSAAGTAIRTSYSTGAVTGGNNRAGFSQGSATVTASYWDTERSGIADDADSAAPEGLTTSALQTPTEYGATGIYSSWNDQDVDGDGTSGEATDDDAWHFGTANQHPVLKFGGFDLKAQLDAQLGLVASAASLSLNEAPGSTRANIGHYTLTLNGAPTGSVTVTATSDNPAVTVDSDATPLTRTLAFTSSNWNTPRTVTVTAVADADGVDELALISNAAPGIEPQTLRATVSDDERTGTDYDSDDDGLIEISTLAQLNAMRWDPNGDGAVSVGNAAPFSLAFPGASAGMGCPDGGDANQTPDACAGYELAADLDFDTDDDGDVDASDPGSYANWTPIDYYGASFQGNGRTISNLTIDDGASRFVGLFRRLGSTAKVEGLGLLDANLSASGNRAEAGALVGRLLGAVVASYSTGSVTGDSSGALGAHVGGLAGLMMAGSRLAASHSMATVSGDRNVGGLVGAKHGGLILASYATGPVRALAGVQSLGGLVGRHNAGGVTASYARGAVETATGAGGLTGTGNRAGAYAASYWDRDASGRSDSGGGTAQTTSALQTPTSATGIYASWGRLDVDGDGIAAEAPWDFGTARQHPVLKFGALDAARQFARRPGAMPGFLFDADPSTPAADEAGPLALIEDHAADASKSYTLRLSARPTQAVTATISSAKAAAVAVADTDAVAAGVQNSLVFSAADWGTARTVTLRARGDADGADESVAIAHAATTARPSEYTDVSNDFMASVADDETPAISLSASTLEVPEQGSASYTVRLATPPAAGSVTVTIGGAGSGLTADASAASGTQTAMTFTASNWNTAQTVTVSAADDLNSASESATLTHTASAAASSEYAGLAAMLTASSADNDAPSLTVSPTRLTVSENGSAATYSIRLGTQPSGEVTVAVLGAVGSLTLDADDGATGDQSSLRFTATSWSTGRTVTVRAAADDNALDETYRLTHSASGGGYDGLAMAGPVAATVDDDDLGVVLLDADPATAALDGGPLLLKERSSDAANAKGYAVRLSAAPTGVVTVAVASGDAAKVTVDAASLTFTTTNWSTARTVTATAQDDSDALDESVTITHTASGGGYNAVASRLRATVSDEERTGTDYDADEDGLIEISSLAQLNAIRWDLDGDGAASSGNASSYSSAFPGASAGMGCPRGGCEGYELAADLDFDTDGDGDVDASDTGSYASWTPIGPVYAAAFHGNGRTISNLTISDSTSAWVGLFAQLGSASRVEELGLPDASVSATADGTRAGALAGGLEGVVIASHSTGSVAADSSVVRSVRAHAGGLVGLMSGSGARLAACHSKATVSADLNAGGLVGTKTGGAIVASYATGWIRVLSRSRNVGGLAGRQGGGSILASYTAGAVDHWAGKDGGLTGTAGVGGTFTASYWDREASGLVISGGGIGQTTSALQTPTSATGIYALWGRLDVDGDGIPAESPWDFGTSSQYPALSYRSMDPVAQRGDYDLDGDGLIEVRTLAQLNAIRWDPNGDGAPSSGSAAAYGKAFPGHADDMGCPTSAADSDDNDCKGYELENDLDFDTDGDGDVDAGDPGSYASWTPIDYYGASFQGNGRTISNLTIDDGASRFVGLFKRLGSTAKVEGLGLLDVNLSASGNRAEAGALVGRLLGAVVASYSTGSVTGDSSGALGAHVGGLAGLMMAGSRLAASHSTATVSGDRNVGGLVGAKHGGLILASYATGPVRALAGVQSLGGLVGRHNAGGVTASYARGAVETATGAGGLTGAASAAGTYTASYWDTETSGRSASGGGTGQTTSALQTPTAATGIYAAWDDQDVDGDGTAGEAGDDDAWDFGTARQHPVLKFGGLDAARQFARRPGAMPGFLFDADPSTPAADEAGPLALIEDHAADASKSYTVRLSARPTRAVTATISSAKAAAVAVADTDAVAAGVQNSLVFSAADWGTARTVTLRARGDADGADESVAIAHAATTARPSEYTDVSNDFMASVADDETPAISLSASTLEVPEQGSASYTVRLATPPAAGAVTVTIGGTGSGLTADASAASGTQTAMTFTASNWNTAQTVTVSAADDLNSASESATLTHTASAAASSEYADVTATLIASSADNDEPSLTVSPTRLTVNENGSATSYSIRLGTQPSGAVTVTAAGAAGALTLDADDGATGDQSSLRFTATSWSTARTVWVRAAADDNALDETYRLTHSASGGGYDGLAMAGAVAATVDDDDLGVVLLDADPATAALDAGPLLLKELSSDAANAKGYAVRLSAAPTGVVTVTVASGDAAKVTVDATSLSFTTTNWSTARTVTATAQDDADALDESVTITHTASGGGYNAVASRLRATVSDEERTGTDYDADEDGLIEISSLAQLNAIRWDLDGDGAASSGNASSYSSAFPGASAGMGCPRGGCEGYELAADLDFDTDGDGDVDAQDTGSYASWTPIGPVYAAAFHGNGRTISNLTISDSTSAWVGLFAQLGSASRVEELGLPDANVSATADGTRAGALAGGLEGVVIASHSTGSVAADSSVVRSVRAHAGGLAGLMSGSGARLAACHSKATVSADLNAGGLVGTKTGGAIVASYATGWIRVLSRSRNVGGLAGRQGGGSILASYTAGAVDHWAGKDGGLTGTAGVGGTFTASYWDREASGLVISGGGIGQTTSALQTPTSATGIYALWGRLDVDGDGIPAESPWDFGTSSQYPALSYRSMDPVAQRGDYDLDGDGLIEVRTLAQLNAIRWDPNGDGAPSSGNAAAYGKAFPGHADDMGCPTSAADSDDNDCKGYELESDLDFDTDGDGDVDAGDPGSYASWTPIGPVYASTFQGNGRTISNLTISDSTSAWVGLFAQLGSAARVEELGLADASISASANGAHAGALAGDLQGTAFGIHSTGAVTADSSGATGARAGGLAGRMSGSGARMAASHSAATVSSDGGSGGLAGLKTGGAIVASYAIGSIRALAGARDLGGLVGRHSGGSLAASYARGAVETAPGAGGLTGAASTAGTYAASYWDTEASGRSASGGGAGQTTSALQTPTAATGIYAAWDDQDVDGDGTAGEAGDDDAWDFGTARQHPVLKFGALDAARQFARRPGPMPGFLFDADPSTPAADEAGPLALIEDHAADASKSYTVRLSARPTQAVTATISSAKAAAVAVADTDAVAAGVQNSLVFSAADWGTARTVTLRARGDADGADESVAIAHAATTARPSEYTDVSNDFMASVADDETPAIVLSASTLEVPEQGSASYTVRLATPPAAGAVTVTIGGAGSGLTADASAASGTQTAMTFTSSNWNTAQTVTVSAADDLNSASESATLTHTASAAASSEYAGLAATLIASSADNDVPSLTVSPTRLTVSENGSAASYSIRLGTQPSGEVTVAVLGAVGSLTLDADDGATGDQSSLRFTATSWSTARTVTVRAAADDNALDETYRLTHSASGGGYDGLAMAGAVAATVDDDDLGVVLLDADPATAALDGGPLLLKELSSDAANAKGYAVRLSAAPTGVVTVAVSSGDAAKVTVDSASLTFTTTNWSTARTVTATAQDDSDALDESVTITHTAAGGGYNAVASRLRAAVSDEERTGTDYDADEDGLIEIASLAQLNAVRWDLDGDGTASSGNASSYSSAFPGASAGMGCPRGGCEGYELAADLDFDTDGDGDVDAQDTGSHPNWTPIGPVYTATLHGNGRTISHLTISDSTSAWVGLFAQLGSASRVEELGLPDANISAAADGTHAGALAGGLEGVVIASHSTGRVAADSPVARSVRSHAGGLVGLMSGSGARLTASHSTATISADFDAGGLVGLKTDGAIVASYATGSIRLVTKSRNMGGLVGRQSGGSTLASYAAGAVDGRAGKDGGLIGTGIFAGIGTCTASYWDTEASGRDLSGCGIGQTTSALQTPTSATGIYALWGRLDVDGDGIPAESPWDFGSSSQYPALKYRSMDPTAQRSNYDLDDDGLIKMQTLAPLNAIRRDLDGASAPSSGNAAAYSKAFRSLAGELQIPAASGGAYDGPALGAHSVAPAPIEDQTLLVGADALRIDLAEQFEAAEGETLSYAAHSSDSSAIQVRIENGMLILAAVGEGSATVTVTATDADGLSETLRFEARAERTARSRWRGWRLILLEPESGS